MYVNLQDMAIEAFRHIEKKEFESAERKLTYLLDAEPNSSVLYYFLGCLYLSQKKYAFSAMAYEKSVALDPKFDQSHNNLSTAYRQLGNIDKCRAHFQKAIEIARAPDYKVKAEDPDRAKRSLADYIANYGSTFVAKGVPQQAIKIINEALQIYPELPNAMWNRGLAYLELGEWKKGFADYDMGERIGPEHERHYHGAVKNTPCWDGTKGQTIVVYGEQGIGDEIMFASMLPDVMKDADVILEAHPRLCDMFRVNFPNTPVYGTRKSPKSMWPANHKIDAKIAIGSLGKIYRKKDEDFPGTPYMVPDPKYKALMKAKLDALGDKPKIGLSWKGGIGVTNKAVRTIDPKQFLPLFEFDADFISLQYHKNAQAEVDKFNEATGKEIMHWQDVIDDYDLTAGLITNLDLIISVPQSVVHLAGAMGVKTFQLCPIDALWQMGVYGKDAPWYKCVRNIWQPKRGDYDTPIKRVVDLIKEKGIKEC